MAKIGTVSESGRSSARIFSDASKPFITGIMMSIKMRSYVPGAEALNFSSPSAPFHAFVTSAPLSSSRNGLEAAEKIRALDRPDSETVPIFAMTANAFSDDAARSRKAGMNEHLTKPLDLEKITKAVRKYCKKNSR